MDDRDLTRLAAMAEALRPDWPARSVRAFLAKQFRGSAFEDVAVALAAVAVDAETKTPQRLVERNSPWWRAAQAARGASEIPEIGPGRGAARCGRAGHEHERESSCRLCRAEQLQDLLPDEAPQKSVPPPGAFAAARSRAPVSRPNTGRRVS